MISFLKRLLINNWQRKLISFILAIVTWMAINHSSTITKTLADIPVKIINLPIGKTVEGIGPDGILSKKITLTLTGNSNILEEISENDLEVVIDAKDKTGEEWIANVSKKNLVCYNPEVNLLQGINKVYHHDFIIKMSKLVTERIPILVTQPIGEPPKGYQYLDIWPYYLYITVSGPESFVKQLKTKGLKLTYNLNDLSESDLNTLRSSKDSISFFIPSSWKKVSIPALSPSPMDIDDPQAKWLRIDFVQKNLLPLKNPIPITIFFPPKYSDTLNPDTFTLATNSFVEKKNGLKMISMPLFAKGVSPLFLDIVKDMIQMVITAIPKSSRDSLSWNVQFIQPSELEDRFVAKVIAQFSDNDTKNDQPELQEAYLRNRFRAYMTHFRLYTKDNQKLNLKIELQANTITVTPIESCLQKP